jgi:citrate lyase subunit beta / citryl-CoA lyase
MVPGHRLDWMLKAPKYGPDALQFDLEDSVPVDEKASAREFTSTALQQLGAEPIGRFVRINRWGTGDLVVDLESIVSGFLDGVSLAKTESPSDVEALDRVLTELEIRRNLPVGRIEIIPVCETARGIYRHHEICLASERIRRSGSIGIVAPGADIARALGIRMTLDGDEALYVNVRSGLEARAAGIVNINGGMTTTIDDLPLVRRIAERAKALGATEATAIHPSHVAILNEVFSPTEAEIVEARRTILAMDEAVSIGRASVRLDGKMIDYAHVRSSLDLLRSARRFGIDIGGFPEGRLEEE